MIKCIIMLCLMSFIPCFLYSSVRPDKDKKEDELAREYQREAQELIERVKRRQKTHNEKNKLYWQAVELAFNERAHGRLEALVGKASSKKGELEVAMLALYLYELPTATHDSTRDSDSECQLDSLDLSPKYTAILKGAKECRTPESLDT